MICADRCEVALTVRDHCRGIAYTLVSDCAEELLCDIVQDGTILRSACSAIL